MLHRKLQNHGREKTGKNKNCIVYCLTLKDLVNLANGAGRYMALAHTGSASGTRQKPTSLPKLGPYIATNQITTTYASSRTFAVCCLRRFWKSESWKWRFRLLLGWSKNWSLSSEGTALCGTRIYILQKDIDCQSDVVIFVFSIFYFMAKISRKINNVRWKQVFRSEEFAVIFSFLKNMKIRI